MASRSSGRTEKTQDIDVNIEAVASGKKLSRKDERLVQWKVKVLVTVLKLMAARRQLLGVRPDTEVF
jgi:hypothetical protein